MRTVWNLRWNIIGKLISRREKSLNKWNKIPKGKNNGALWNRVAASGWHFYLGKYILSLLLPRFSLLYSILVYHIMNQTRDRNLYYKINLRIRFQLVHPSHLTVPTAFSPFNHFFRLRYLSDTICTVSCMNCDIFTITDVSIPIKMSNKRRFPPPPP